MAGGGCRAGRAARRRRRRRRRKRDSSLPPESLSHQLKYVRLMKFLHQRGFTSTPLIPALFSDTDRGLQTLQSIQPGGMMISLPESCLLTTSTVLLSYLGPFLKSWKPRPSALVALCVFLVCERHRGEASDWFPYIDVLPRSYSCPPYFTDSVMAVLPAGVRKRAEEQREALQHLYAFHQDFFRSLQSVLSCPPEEVLTYEALRWAWCSINTRSVFMSQPPSSFLSGPDNYALAPFLDLLNHQPDVQVKAGFNRTTGCYEVRSISGVQRYHQAFINYGSHDNQRLLLEYGFVSSCNPHSVLYIEEGNLQNFITAPPKNSCICLYFLVFPDLLCEVLKGDKSQEEKIKFLRENHFLQNLTLSDEGPSWRLLTALRLLSLPQVPRRRWRAVLLGQIVGDEMEERSVLIVKTLCEHLLKETRRSLQEISHLLQLCEQPIREQLEAVGSLRTEERGILGNCLEVLKSAVEI